jgi:hypothetical protein
LRIAVIRQNGRENGISSEISNANIESLCFPSRMLHNRKKRKKRKRKRKETYQRQVTEEIDLATEKNVWRVRNLFSLFPCLLFRHDSARVIVSDALKDRLNDARKKRKRR